MNGNFKSPGVHSGVFLIDLVKLHAFSLVLAPGVAEEAILLEATPQNLDA